jgi:viroplasmin and RNaseH domain-containing protein
MAKHYYGVREGREIGVYENWSDCEYQVKGYSGAEYKKFNTYEEALSFINGKEKTDKGKKLATLKDNEIIAYVDGSFDKNNRYYSYGVVIFTLEGKENFSQKENDDNMVDMRNVAGEIRGAMFAMEQAIMKKKEILYLHYDYMGIEKWAIGEWKTNKYGTQRYKKYFDSIKDKIKVVFIKVKAHSGDEYNEEADRLAKEALGIKA